MCLDRLHGVIKTGGCVNSVGYHCAQCNHAFSVVLMVLTKIIKGLANILGRKKRGLRSTSSHLCLMIKEESVRFSALNYRFGK